MSIPCYAAFEPKGVLKKFEYEPGDLGLFDVMVEISYCGICHSDIHLIDNDWKTSAYPLVPGHEIVGVVRRKGKEVGHLRLGQRVGIGWRAGSCLCCEWCLKGEDNLCDEGISTCVNRHGGFAEAVRVDGRFVFPIPENIPSESAAPLLCGGITVYSPLSHLVRPAMKVGVVGIGGLGHLALQFARAFGCEVTAFSCTSSKKKDALHFGAHHFVVTDKPNAVKNLKNTIDVIISTAHVGLDWQGYVDVLRPNGTLCVVGAASGDIRVSVSSLIVDQKAVRGSVIGGRPGIMEMLEFASRHNISPRVEVLPLSSVNAAIASVRRNQARYRMVLQCRGV